jgi:hypothetical protein
MQRTLPIPTDLRSRRYEELNLVVQGILDAEKAAREKKTHGLREERLARLAETPTIIVPVIRKKKSNIARK